MTALTLTAEQIRTAPPEVRKWLKAIVDAQFRLGSDSEPDPQVVSEAVLAACSLEEAKAVFALVRDDYLAAQVLLELGRHAPSTAGGTQPVVGSAVADLARHARLDSLHQLGACVERLSLAFRRFATTPPRCSSPSTRAGSSMCMRRPIRVSGRCGRALSSGTCRRPPRHRPPRRRSLRAPPGRRFSRRAPARAGSISSPRNDGHGRPPHPAGRIRSSGRALRSARTFETRSRPRLGEDAAPASRVKACRGRNPPRYGRARRGPPRGNRRDLECPSGISRNAGAAVRPPRYAPPGSPPDRNRRGRPRSGR